MPAPGDSDSYASVVKRPRTPSGKSTPSKTADTPSLKGKTITATPTKTSSGTPTKASTGTVAKGSGSKARGSKNAPSSMVHSSGGVVAVGPSQAGPVNAPVSGTSSANSAIPPIRIPAMSTTTPSKPVVTKPASKPSNNSGATTESAVVTRPSGANKRTPNAPASTAKKPALVSSSSTSPNKPGSAPTSTSKATAASPLERSTISAPQVKAVPISQHTTKPRPRPVKKPSAANVATPSAGDVVGAAEDVNMVSPIKKTITKFKVGRETVDVPVDVQDSEITYVSSDPEVVPVADRTDSAYRGRVVTSRVAGGNESIIRTRSARAKEASASGEPPSVAPSNAPRSDTILTTPTKSQGDPITPNRAPKTPSQSIGKSSKNSSKKTFKSAELVPSEDEHSPPPSSPPVNTPTPKRRRIKQPVASDVDSESETDALLEARIKRLKRKHGLSPSPINASLDIDVSLEADSGSPGPAPALEQSPDEYDLDDPFIDDTALEEGDIEAGSSGSEHAMDVDEQGGGALPSDDDLDSVTHDEALEHEGQFVEGGSEFGSEQQHDNIHDDQENVFEDDLQYPESEADIVQGDDGDIYFEDDAADLLVDDVVEVEGAGSSPMGSDVDDDEPSMEPSAAPPTVGRTFAEVFGSLAGDKDISPDATDQEVYLEDLEYSTVADRPTQCEVTRAELQERAMRPFYAKLALIAVRAGSLKSWSDLLSEKGLTEFSRWARICPHMNFDRCLAFLNFVKHRNFLNLARATFDDVLIRKLPGAKQRYYLYTVDHRPALCVSCVMVTESYVLAPRPSGMKQRSVAGVFHMQEYERTVGYICTAFGHRELGAQVFKNAVSFTTRTNFKKDDDPQSSASPGNGFDISQMLSGVPTPSSTATGDVQRHAAAEPLSLDWDAEIPVYDCRRVDMTVNDMIDNRRSLPRWEEEIPKGTFLVPVYTVAVFFSNKTKYRPAGWMVGFNILYAFILGIPGMP